MWHLLSMYCSGRHARDVEVSVIRWLTSGRLLEMYKQKGKSGLIVSVLHFVYVDLYGNGYIYIYIPALYNQLGFSMSMTTLLLVDCYSVYATTSIFHFPEQRGDPRVYFIMIELWPHNFILMSWQGQDVASYKYFNYYCISMWTHFCVSILL